MPETNPPNPSDAQKPSDVDGDDNPTAIIPPVGARPDGLTNEEWALIESRRGNQEPHLAATAPSLGSDEIALGIVDLPSIVPTPETIGVTIASAETTLTNSVETKSPEKKPRLLIGATIVAAIAVVIGIWVVTRQSGDQDVKPAKKTTTVASTKPPPATPAEAIGVQQKDYNVLNVQPSRADIEKALQPLSFDDYTPKEAVVEFGKKMNAFDIGGKIDNDQATLVEADSSKTQANEQLAAMFGEKRVTGPESVDFDGLRNIREMVANRFNVYDGEKPGTLVNVEKRQKEYATANESWSVDSIDASDSDKMTFIINVGWNTNFEALDRSDSFDNPGIDQPSSSQKMIKLQVVDGHYQIESLTAR